MIAPLLFAAALDYTAEGAIPLGASPEEQDNLSITKRRKTGGQDPYEQTLTRHAGTHPRGECL
jgi:hypothetical protein